jgi:hypothetical protein
MSVEEYNRMKSSEGRVHEGDHDFESEEDWSFTIDDIPQAFSHFTYIFSKRKFLVCDLQGVLNNDSNEPVFELTDPVIHYSEMTNRLDFGRTDRGQQGIHDFFRTHKCSNLCHMLSRRWIPDPYDNEITHYEYVPFCEPIQEAAKTKRSEDDNKETRNPMQAKTVKFNF